MIEALNPLPSESFFKVHKSYMINLNQVKKIERHQVELSDNAIVPIAGNYHSELLDALKKLWTVK